MSHKFRSHVPPEYICPITVHVMHDPVIGPDGDTYERFAISMWIEHNIASLVTRQQMKDNLIPNISLRNSIQASEYRTTIEPRIQIDVKKTLASYKHKCLINDYTYNIDGTFNLLFK